jgi:fatty-acid peroxygenase
MSPDQITRLAEYTAEEWRRGARQWESRDQVVLYEALQEVLTRAVCRWAGVPLAEREVGLRTRELTALFDAAGAVGPRHWWSRLARRRAERWIQDVVRAVRAGQLSPTEGTALSIIATHREPDGQRLSPRVAAVELLNVLRPTVAVAVYLTDLAHALHQYPEARAELVAGDDRSTEWFVQEVRRFYPFFPSVMARVRRDFTWQGYRFRHGRRVILDLYGTNHDPRTWEAPSVFRPQRFAGWDGDPFTFIPQGGGDHQQHHRCPGEWITIELMKTGLRLLTDELAYEVPPQDLTVDDTRLPALPRSHFVMRNVRLQP